MKRVILHHILTIWQESWSQQLNNKLHSVKPVIGAWLEMPMRRADVKLTHLRIGHTRFTHRGEYTTRPSSFLMGQPTKVCTWPSDSLAPYWFRPTIAHSGSECTGAKQLVLTSGHFVHDVALLSSKQFFHHHPRTVTLQSKFRVTNHEPLNSKPLSSDENYIEMTFDSLPMERPGVPLD
ncbi:RNase H domain-containing protein [Trichonephila clavipes]|nr:RNase H domain-containing protein [Trichonephila clavipes]